MSIVTAPTNNTTCETISLTHWTQWDSTATDCFSQNTEWLQNAWEKFHTQQCGVNAESLICLQVASEQGEVLGNSAWFKEFSKGIVWWRMVGSGAVCSDYVQLPCKPGKEIDVAQATANWFASQPRRFIEAPIAIEVEGHRSNCPQWQAFFETLIDSGWTSDSVFIESAWRVQLPESWKAYDSMLSKSRRRKARRAIKMHESGEMDYQLLTSVEDIEKNWAEFVQLHQMRRIQLGQPGCFNDTQFERFLKSATIEYAYKKSAFLARVDHQGKPLAMLLVFTTDSTWFIYQSGFDTSRIDLEPGHVVNALTLKRAIESGIKTLDYLRGDEPYKSGWLATPNPLSRTILLPPGLASRGISSALKIKRNIQAWIKKSSATSVDNESSYEA